MQESTHPARPARPDIAGLSFEEALAAERQIKGWSRAKKEALICGDWGEISRLAKSTSRKQD